MRQPTDDCYSDPLPAGPLFAQTLPGPFDNSTKAPDGILSSIASVVWRHKGRTHAVSLAELVAGIGISPREIKGKVAELVLEHGCMIGAARQGDSSGYFWICDSEDLKAAIGPYQAQIDSMQGRVRALEQMARERGIA